MPKEAEKKGERQRKSGQPVRLYVKGAFTGFKRSRRAQHEGQALLQLEGVKDRASARWYLGKRVAYISKAKT
jgi:large subunit ribosomal protein L35Ae